jgi:adenine specific DNA methylase Mod
LIQSKGHGYAAHHARGHAQKDSGGLDFAMATSHKRRAFSPQPKPAMTNQLYYGDNLPVMREHIADESVDLIYLDPPFKSDANYNLLFKADGLQPDEAQVTAFKDTWTWDEREG